jgi:hypothetical protein
MIDFRNYDLKVGMIGTFAPDEFWCEDPNDSKIVKVEIVEIVPTEVNGSTGIIKSQLIRARLLEPFTRTKNGVTRVIEAGERIFLGAKGFIPYENI